MKKIIEKSLLIAHFTLLLLISAMLVTSTSCSKDSKFVGEIVDDDDDDDGSDVPVAEDQYDVNLALAANGGSATTSSIQDEDCAANKLTDGITNNQNSYFGTSQGPSQRDEWIRIKLMHKQHVNSVWLYPRIAGEGFPEDFMIQVSSDNANSWKTVKTITGHAQPLTNAPVKIDFDQEMATHVRIFMTKLASIANVWTGWVTVYYVQVREVEVYLSTGQTQLSDNFALEGIATSSSQEEGAFGPYQLTDGKTDESSQFYFGTLASENPGGEWAQIKLNRKGAVNEIWLYPRYGETGVSGFPVDFQLKVSADGSSWTTVATETDYPVPSALDPGPEKFFFGDVEAEYVRLEVSRMWFTNNQWTDFQDRYVVQLAEIEVYKDKSN